jgi:hypothetical protein
MPYAPKVLDVLNKYRIYINGKPRQIKKKVNGTIVSVPFVEKEVIDRLVAADITENQDWIDWIFFQAGGGNAAAARRPDAIKRTGYVYRQHWINGFTTADGKHVDGVSKEVAEKYWLEKQKPIMEEYFISVPEDLIDTYQGTFGYSSHWPGKYNIYARIENALKLYFETIGDFNSISSEAKLKLKTEPRNFPSVADLASYAERLSLSIKNSVVKLNRGKGQKDSVIYDDDYCVAIAPASYAAAVRYGNEHWGLSSKKLYRDYMYAPNATVKTEWENIQAYNPVFIRVKVPMPVVLNPNEFKYSTIALNEFLVTSAKPVPHSANDLLVTWADGVRREDADIFDIIAKEPLRKPTRSMTNVINTGAPRIKTPEQAKEVIRHLNLCLKAIKEWYAEKDAESIRQNVS